MMSLKKIGLSDIKLSSIGLGCWQFSKNTGFAGSFWPKPRFFGRHFLGTKLGRVWILLSLNFL